MLAQVDGAFAIWRSGRAPIDTYIQREIQASQAIIDSGKATSNSVQLFAGILGAVFLITLAFYMFYLILRPLVKLAKTATVLASGEPIAIKPTRRRDELGQLTSALAAWQRSSQDLVDGLRDGSSTAAASASYLSSVSERRDYHRAESCDGPIGIWFQPLSTGIRFVLDLTPFALFMALVLLGVLIAVGFLPSCYRRRPAG